MIVRNSVTSRAAAKWLGSARSTAKALVGHTSSKKRMADGFLMISKKVGPLRSATVIELPSKVLVNSHVSDSAIDRKTRAYHVSSRDLLDPSTPLLPIPTSDASLEEFSEVSFGFPPVSGASILSSGALGVLSEHESYHCSVLKGPAPAGKHWLNVSCTPRRGERRGWSYNFEGVILGAMFPGLSFLYLTSDNDQRLAQPVAIRKNNLLYIFTVMAEISEFTWPNGVEYSTARHHITMIVLDINQNEDPEQPLFSYTWGRIPLDDLLPQWSVPSTLKRPINGHGLVDFPADSYVRITSAMLDKEGAIVLAFNYAVRVQTYYNGIEDPLNPKLAKLAAAGRAEVLDGLLTKVDLYDVDVFAWNGASEINYPLEPEISREFTRPLISVGLTADAKVITNGMTYERRTEGIFDTPYLEPVTPYCFTAINGVQVADHSDGYGALYTVDAEPISGFVTQGKNANSLSYAAVSEVTTVGTWYEPKNDPSKKDDQQKYGVLFTDGERVKHFRLGETASKLAGQDVQLSCPQKEVRGEHGELLSPSTIIASYWDGGVYISVRKGPIWPEDMVEGQGGEESSFWSEPQLIDASDVPAVYYTGNEFMDALHGSLYAGATLE